MQPKTKAFQRQVQTPDPHEGSHGRKALQVQGKTKKLLNQNFYSPQVVHFTQMIVSFQFNPLVPRVQKIKIQKTSFN